MPRKVIVALVTVLILLGSVYIGGITVVWAVGPRGTWFVLDAGSTDAGVVKDYVDYDRFTHAYTLTATTDPDSSSIVAAWTRIYDDATYIFMAILKYMDVDGDRLYESCQKIVRNVSRDTEDTIPITREALLDSIVVGDGFILITWTSFADKDSDVYGVVYDLDTATPVWKGAIASIAGVYEEYSCACWVPGYNHGSGGFLVVWYNSIERSLHGTWIYRSGSSWTVSSEFIIDYVRLRYREMRHTLCIGGYTKALVVYRAKDNNEIGIYGALISDKGVELRHKLIYDYQDQPYEYPGVGGGYIVYNGIGFFGVPFTSGSYKGYAIVRETDGRVERATTYDGRGRHPYIIGVNVGKPRFVMTWIDPDGNVVVGNIIPDPDNDGYREWYIYSTTLTGTAPAYHPLIAYDPANDAYLALWTGYCDEDQHRDNNIRAATLNPFGNGKAPSLISIYTLVDMPGDQILCGVGALSILDFTAVYLDHSDGEEDLMVYLSFSGRARVDCINVYALPAQGEEALNAINNLILDARDTVYVAVSFWEGSVGMHVADAIIRSGAVEKLVIMDDGELNDPIRDYLIKGGVDVRDDSVLGDPEHVMHEKFVVADDNVIIMTADLRDNDFRNDYNLVVTIKSRVLAYYYLLEARHMAGGFFGPMKSMDNSFIVLGDYGGTIVFFEGIFSPQSSTLADKIPQAVAGYISRSGIDNARGIIYFLSYIFTTSYLVRQVYEALVDVARYTDVKVSVYFDELMNVDTPYRRIYSFIDRAMEIEGLKVMITIPPRRLHARLAVIDTTASTALLIGSWNPTKSGTVLHDEFMLIIRGGVGPIIGSVVGFIEDDIARRSVDATRPYNPNHLIISKVYFYGPRELEYVEICNPTDNVIDLSNYVIGDAENLLYGDDEGLYKFPDGAKIGRRACIIMAFDGKGFRSIYGFNPDYEIIDSLSDVPNMQRYDPRKFTGQWDLDDTGDEVILARVRHGFFVVEDAIWYGSSRYIVGTGSGRPLDIPNVGEGKAAVLRNNGVDSVIMNDKYEIRDVSNRMPVVSYRLLNNRIMEFRAEDPDGLGACVEKVRIYGSGFTTTITGSRVDLSSLNAPPGIYNIDVIVSEDTKLGRRGTWTYTYKDKLAIMPRTIVGRISVTSSNNDIIQVRFYRVNSTHGALEIIIEGVKRGFVNATIPAGWTPKIVFIDGIALSRDKWGFDPSRRILWIDPIDPSNITALGPLPQTARATRSMGGLAEPYNITIPYVVTLAMLVMIPLWLLYRRKR